MPLIARLEDMWLFMDESYKHSWAMIRATVEKVKCDLRECASGIEFPGNAHVDWRLFIDKFDWGRTTKLFAVVYSITWSMSPLLFEHNDLESFREFLQWEYLKKQIEVC